MITLSMQLNAIFPLGLIAAYIQLWRGTKYSRFPNWLDDWLKMRKQLGLLMLGMAAVHVSPNHPIPIQNSLILKLFISFENVNIVPLG